MYGKDILSILYIYYMCCVYAQCTMYIVHACVDGWKVQILDSRQKEKERVGEYRKVRSTQDRELLFLSI